jgi:hypothetical protein
LLIVVAAAICGLAAMSAGKKNDVCRHDLAVVVLDGDVCTIN